MNSTDRIFKTANFEINIGAMRVASLRQRSLQGERYFCTICKDDFSSLFTLSCSVAIKDFLESNGLWFYRNQLRQMLRRNPNHQSILTIPVSFRIQCGATR